jgi:hypothetical protein
MLRGIREKGRPTMNLRTLFSALFLCASLSTQAATELLPLKHRLAEDLLPAAQAVLNGEGSVTAYGNQLIVTSTPEKMRELRELVEQLDAPARRLLISVSTHESGTYTVNSPDHSRAPLRIINHNTTRNAGVRQIHASEGHPAFIQTGQSIPVTTYSSGPYGELYADTQHRELARGLYVTARLNGDTVHLALSSQHDSRDQSFRESITTRQADTRVSGQLGEWILIGSSAESNRVQHGGSVVRHSTGSPDDFILRVKVDVLP